MVIEAIPASTTPVPEASLAFCRRLVKEAPVDALPPFVTVAEKTVALLAVAVVGVTPPVVRSGAGAGPTFTVAELFPDPAELVQVMV